MTSENKTLVDNVNAFARITILDHRV